MRMAKRYCRCEDCSEEKCYKAFDFITHFLNSGENVIDNEWKNTRVVGRAENSVRLARGCLAICEYCGIVALFIDVLFCRRIQQTSNAAATSGCTVAAYTSLFVAQLPSTVSAKKCVQDFLCPFAYQIGMASRRRARFPQALVWYVCWRRLSIDASGAR